MINIKNIDGLELLKSIQNKSIDLILTDPPYIISRESGMNTHYNNVKNNVKEFVKTEEEWTSYKKEKEIKDDSKKEKLS
jgi:site-specific DNA-methyltransferase (adenine-specific)